MGPMQPHLTHFAINTDDVGATKAFYAAVFGWQFRDYGPPGFVQIMDESGNSPMGAIQQRRQLLDNEPTRGFECTFGVEDVDATRRACRLGRRPHPDGEVHNLQRRSPHRLPGSWRQPCTRDGIRHRCGVAPAPPDPAEHDSAPFEPEPSHRLSPDARTSHGNDLPIPHVEGAVPRVGPRCDTGRARG